MCFWLCCSFLLEATQFVFFGGLFQGMSSFLFGFLVFGATVIACVGWTAIKAPQQIKNAFNNPGALIGVNVMAVLAFTSLPAFRAADRAGNHIYDFRRGDAHHDLSAVSSWEFARASPCATARKPPVTFLLLCGLIYLSVITVAGLSGFVRGDQNVAITGILLAIADGAFFTCVLVFSKRLDTVGVGPGAVLGLRLPLYVSGGGCMCFAGHRRQTTISRIGDRLVRIDRVAADDPAALYAAKGCYDGFDADDQRPDVAWAIRHLRAAGHRGQGRVCLGHPGRTVRLFYRFAAGRHRCCAGCRISLDELTQDDGRVLFDQPRHSDGSLKEPVTTRYSGAV